MSCIGVQAGCICIFKDIRQAVGATLFCIFRFQFYSSSLLLIYEGEFVDGSSDSDEEFMHKYRCRQLPGLPTENYLATIRKVMRDTDEKFGTTGKKFTSFTDTTYVRFCSVNA